MYLDKNGSGPVVYGSYPNAASSNFHGHPNLLRSNASFSMPENARPNLLDTSGSNHANVVSRGMHVGEAPPRIISQGYLIPPDQAGMPNPATRVVRVESRGFPQNLPNPGFSDLDHPESLNSLAQRTNLRDNGEMHLQADFFVPKQQMGCTLRSDVQPVPHLPSASIQESQLGSHSQNLAKSVPSKQNKRKRKRSSFSSSSEEALPNKFQTGSGNRKVNRAKRKHLSRKHKGSHSDSPSSTRPRRRRSDVGVMTTLKLPAADPNSCPGDELKSRLQAMSYSKKVLSGDEAILIVPSLPSLFTFP